jgi:hypothetical protein
MDLYLSKDSYRYGRNTPTLIFENLKSVEISKNHLNIHKSCIVFKIVKIYTTSKDVQMILK